MTRKFLNYQSVCGVEQTQCVVRKTSDNLTAIAVTSHRCDSSRKTFDFAEFRLSRITEIPDANCFIIAAGNQPCVVVRKCERQDIARMPDQRMRDFVCFHAAN